MPVFTPGRKKSEEWSSHMIYLAHSHPASRSPVFRLLLEWSKSDKWVNHMSAILLYLYTLCPPPPPMLCKLVGSLASSVGVFNLFSTPQ